MSPFTYPTAIVGRQEELTDILSQLMEPRCRLLTLVGVGGVGKTRLALEVASRAADGFDDGSCFVDLQPVEAESFLPTLADALPSSLSGREPLQAQLFNYLRDKKMLLLLDNFEHLLSEATFLIELLSAAPAVKLLVTSREALNLQQEWLYPLNGLPVPPALSTEDIAEYGAVQLFQERARRVQPDFALADEQRAVVRICRLVEGLPLALELAASWARTLPCADIAEEIERNLDFLSRSLRDMPERHQSMQAVFDQTWRLLTEAERHVFPRLSLFRGGFQRDAAEAVAGATLNVLAALVDKCMVQRERGYHIHELLRQFGEEKLRASPEEAATVRRRHIEFYTAFLHDRVETMQGIYQRQAAIEIAGEWDNVRAAWQRAVADGNVDAIGRAATTLHYFCQLKSLFLEGATMLEAAATCLEDEPVSRERDLVLAQLFNHEGWLRIRVGEFERARQILEQSCALYEKHAATPPPYMGSDSSVPLSTVALIQGDVERAVALCESARQAAEARGDKHNLAFSHYGLAAARLAQGHYDAAYRHAEESCKVVRVVGNRWFLTYPLIEWGNVARAMGNLEEAEQHYRASYALKEEFDDPEGMAVTLRCLGEIAVSRGRYQEATPLFQQSLALYRDLDDRGGLATCLKGLGQVAHAAQELSTASESFRRALQIAEEIEYRPLICAILLDAAALLQSRDKPKMAIALLTMIQKHPASNHESRQQAQQQLKGYESGMAASEFAAAVEQGKAWSLDRALAKLDSELIAVAEEVGAPVEPHEQPLIEPLTDREMDVLRLLAEGHTNSEIAEELVLALGTVKWYASEIYGKLGVSNRTEAAARARDLKLLPN